jgi:glycosyltransferase involved in cell wall biosynthesis
VVPKGSGESNNTLRDVNSHRRLLLAAQPWDGGVARHVVALVEALPPGRFAVDVACPRGSFTWTSLEGRPGVELHAISPHRRPHPDDARSWVTLHRLVGRADVIHVHSSKAGFIGRLASSLRGKSQACLFSPHGWSFWAARGLDSRFYVQLERTAAHWCRTIVALSADERDAGLAEKIGRPEQYRVIPNGVRLERFALPREPARGRVLMVGRLAPPKRPDLALRALASVRESIPEAELHLVGDGPLRPQAEALTAQLGLNGAVRFLGNREDVPELLATAECALLASDYEGCPLAVVEAMAAAVPVVATDVGGTGELVEAGQTGELGPRGDAQGLASALEQVLANPARAAELGAAGRRVAETRLSLDAMVGSLVELYDRSAPRTRE